MERLVLTTEIAPLHAICTTLDWPNLRELRLRGEPRTVGDLPLSIIAMFAHMSRLRILDLKLKLTKPEESPPRPIWPIRYKSEFPWQELQELTVSFPANNDLIYRKLPDTLRALTLQCFPHITSKFRQHGAEGVSGPIQSSDWLRILRRCNLPLLRSLELEYRENDQDDELLRHLGAAFPKLRQLKVRRYRREGVRMADVPVEHNARTLGSLPQPLDLSLYLDNVEAPDTRVVRGVHHDREEDLAHKFQETLDGVADAVARGLAGTATAVETFALLIPENFDLGSFELGRSDIM
ncbi:hypothetical protein TRAPUB_5054 [Trametes pubescens]|uniref:F-box domain-containing protein n=1 Tax=Trametes pubescens TaxID=154538 RepID=A0A1M2V9F8_TRAPU|nr:hypothetical protein TRAPUB_5054 [Trametes pubescens]